MSLGQQITKLRKERQLSQVDVAAILGVSRQAVSKWETDQSLPDTGNLLALAELFGVTADELAGKKQAAAAPSKPVRRWGWWVLLGLLLVLLAAGIGVMIWGNYNTYAGQVPEGSTPSVPSESSQVPEDLSEFSLFWFDHGVRKTLSLGAQEGPWDYGLDLSTYSVEGPVPTDWPHTTMVRYLCSAPETAPPSFSTFTMDTLCISDPADPPDRESVILLETTAEPFTTPRGIHPGSKESDLLLAYGDELLFGLKEHGGDLLCQHDYFYVYQTGGTQALVFYIANSAVAGIRLLDLLDGAAYGVNNTSVFPVKDGSVDFSQRVEPDKELHDDATLTVFQAFYALSEDENLSQEEIYQTRRRLFSHLPDLDWQTYGAIACEAGPEDPDYANAMVDAQTALTAWLYRQKTFSRDELRWLQQGVRSHPDGFLAEEYSSALANAFFQNPAAFAALLADEDLRPEDAVDVVGLTAYGADYLTEERDKAAAQVESALQKGRYSDPETKQAHYLSADEKAWAQVFLDRLADPYGDKGPVTAPVL